MGNKKYIINIFLCLFSLIYTYPVHNNFNNKKALSIIEKWNCLARLDYINSNYLKLELINAKKLIADYEFLLKACNNFEFNSKINDIDRVVNDYRFSRPIAQLDSKIAAAFEIIKKDLHVDKSVELRVLPDDMYKNWKVEGFFSPMNPGVIYIFNTSLESHPVNIIRIIVHELEHHRQLFCYPDSVKCTSDNLKLLGELRLDRLLEYGADKRVAEYFKCYKALSYLAICAECIFKNSDGYFSKVDYISYVLKYRSFICRGFNSQESKSLDILDYLPGAGIYSINQDNDNSKLDENVTQPSFYVTLLLVILSCFFNFLDS